MQREELLHRTQQAIEKNIDQFYVFEIDENIIACVTLHFFPEKPETAEVGSLYVMPFYHNRGIGRKMVRIRLPPGKRARGEVTRPLDPELRVLHQRLRLPGGRQGDPSRVAAQAV